MADTNIDNQHKFLDYAGLTTYDQKIKQYIAANDDSGYNTVTINGANANTGSTINFKPGNDNISISAATTGGITTVTLTAVDTDTKCTEAGHYDPTGGNNKITDGGNTRTVSNITVDSNGHVTGVSTTPIAFPVTSVAEGTSVENYVTLTVTPTAGDVKITTNDSALKTKIDNVETAIGNIQTLIAGGVHFEGKFDSLPATSSYENGDIVIVGNKEYILYKPASGAANWIELGDTNPESQRIEAIETAYIQNVTATANNGITVALADGTNGSASGDKIATITLNAPKHNALGGVKPAYVNTNAASLGTAAASVNNAVSVAQRTTTAGRYYAVESDKNGVPYVNVPWTDNDTKVTAVDKHYQGTISTSSTDTAVLSNSAFTVVSGVSYDAAGHITGYNINNLTFSRIEDSLINALFD